MSVFDKHNCTRMMNDGFDAVRYVIESRVMENLISDVKRQLRGINENLAKGNLTVAQANDLRAQVRRDAKWKWKVLRSAKIPLKGE